ncbi:MAG: LysM peptidoglycan-binding domain-containing protein, partial [Proteobacteria bacterium]|nr:LysM peptidoglycan-binding domain-containing protein [Pseudomonadota bacterium]
FAASSAKPEQLNDFAGAPPVPGTRRVLAAGEAPEDYTVQRGDTLFDICEQLLGEARYWPKLWALNPEIKNPHFVFPGMKIRFYPGDPEVPPYLLVSTEDEALPVDQGPVAPEDLVIQSPAEKLVTEDQPFDLVDAKDIPVPDDIAREILVSGKIFRRSDVVVDLPAFIINNEADPEGYVFSGGDGNMLVDDSNDILLEETGVFTPGNIYTIIRPSGEVSDESPEGNGRFLGHRYEFVGHVRVVRASESGEDMIVPFVATRKQFVPGISGPSKEVPSMVIGFDRNLQDIGSEGNFVFLKLRVRGSVAEGDLLEIYNRPAFVNARPGTLFYPDKVQRATVRIVDVRGSIATAYIISARGAVVAGDTTTRKSL